MSMRPSFCAAFAAALLLAACGERATIPVEAGYGPDPKLPPPNRTLVPTVLIAPAKGWPQDGQPTPAPGFTAEDYNKRLAFEIGVISKMKFPGYFMIVADFIKWAKENGINVGTGRG